MKPLLILFLFGSFLLICSENFKAEKNENRQLAVISSDYPDSAPGLVSEDFHDLAKNISHSKGIYREEGDLRRSLVNKATISSGSDAVKYILQIFHYKKNKVELLEDLEYLVHQYEVAVHFTNLGGLQLLSQLLFSSDDKIVSSAAIVLGSAMQSNPTVQKIAMEQNIGRKLFYLLSHRSPNVIPRILFAVSAFLRNFPEAQHEFIVEGGISKFRDVFANIRVTISAKLKIVGLISDIAAELKTTEYEEKADLQRHFAEEVQEFDICKYIIMFLILDDYDTHQKTISAMVSLHIICYNDFQNLRIRNKLVRVMKIYFSKNAIYPTIDFDLLKPVMDDIHYLLKKFPLTNFTSNDDPYTIPFNPMFLRDEL